ncbi:acyl-CoA N-acyltransferase [Boeremia exigua]|uniref:acyl-CoA N-acyltransferase n=1 Tax=Boeremia exigua TaxID=749465 RepID=UPI001E8CF975|nr:acyl-CoA N-acyltransferase [Boeremia exigua]KAH6639753.1 acyl-CoA N-acyltransferase [Boeremia exigua]
MASAPAPAAPHISPLEEADYDEWQRLFRLYIAFYKAALPDAQYPRTFARLLSPNKDLHGLVVRDADDPRRLLGLAHYFPTQTPWAEEPVMHLNDLYVDHELRGKGFGRELIKAVAAEARKQGCKRVQWTTQHGNPARKLYDELAACEFVYYRMNLE